MAYQVASLLLRQEQLMTFSALPDFPPLHGSTLHMAGQARPPQHFSELLQDAMPWDVPAWDCRDIPACAWYLHGPPTGQTVPRTWQQGEQDQMTYRDAVQYVEQLAHAYAWCLLPWGVDATGQMLLVLAADYPLFTKLVMWLRDTFNPAAQGLLVSTYTAEALYTQRFRGAIFRRNADRRGHGIWDHGRGTSVSALVLRSDPTAAALETPRSAAVVYHADVIERHPVRRTWLRVHDDAALQHYATDGATVIVTAADLDSHMMQESLGYFEQIFVDIRNDPFYFGLKALQSASWI